MTCVAIPHQEVLDRLGILSGMRRKPQSIQLKSVTVPLRSLVERSHGLLFKTQLIGIRNQNRLWVTSMAMGL